MTEYNKFAKTYEEETINIEEETRNSFYGLFPDLNGKRLLDVGCGPGVDALHYKKQGAYVDGIDISDEEIEIARKKDCGNFLVGNMECLPYKAETFDIVTSFYALQASEVRKSLLEMLRVTKEGGEIILLTKHPFRNFLEKKVNGNDIANYFRLGKVVSYIFNRKIKLTEPGHTMQDYLPEDILKQASLEHFSEHSDFPASENVLPGSNYPTYVMLKFRKK
jgi:ubiquinone/menaquinone biosynthesis C-methylase UbiE